MLCNKRVLLHSGGLKRGIEVAVFQLIVPVFCSMLCNKSVRVLQQECPSVLQGRTSALQDGLKEALALQDGLKRHDGLRGEMA